MDPIRQIECNTISNSNKYESLSFFEEKIIFIEEDGFTMDINEIKVGNIFIIQGRYYADAPRLLYVASTQNAIISHFALQGNCTFEENNSSLENNEFAMFYKDYVHTSHLMQPTGKQGGTFFEVIIPKEELSKLYTWESRFMDSFCNEIERAEYYVHGKKMNIIPNIKSLILDINNTHYKGNLKKLYFEAKLIELFISEISAFDSINFVSRSSLRTGDRDRIYAVKEFLETNLDTDLSIIDLARMVGVNQTKLKNGFKQLFGTTIFGYLTDVRMEMAKHLILNENKYIGEVADLIGYQHPNNFSVAFKRKFGYSPGELKT